MIITRPPSIYSLTLSLHDALPSFKLRNEVLLEVIRSMSLSAPQGKGKFKRRGRISYATLGINQLGAVYEALLSFRGFFAEETLRSEEHTSELQSRENLVCRLLLEK